MSEHEYTIEPATREHAEYVAKNMRSEDREEIWASSFSRPLQTLMSGLKYSEECFVGLDNGVPVLIWGVVEDDLLSNDATPWMLATTALDDKLTAVVFLRRCKNALMELMGNYDTLENYVDARNTRSIRWLKFIGFKVEAPEPYGVLQMPFHKFWMKKEK